MTKRARTDDDELISRNSKSSRVLSGHSPPGHTLSIANCWEITNDALMWMCKDRFLASLFTSIDLSHNGFMTEDELRSVLGMNTASSALHLTSLNLSYCSLSDNFIISVARFAPNLRTISLEGCQLLSDSALIFLSQQCQYLESLSIAKCPLISDVGVAAISFNLSQLQHLDVRDCRRVTGKAMKYIVARCPLIKSLLLGGTSIDQDCLSWLFSFFLLVELDVSSLPLRDWHLELLSKKQPLLKLINISFCQALTGSGIKSFLGNSAIEQIKAFGLTEKIEVLEDSRLIF